MMIDVLPCLQYHNTLDDSHIFQHAEVVIHLLTLIVSACILIIYLLFKTLRNSLFGKLLILYSLGIEFTSTGQIAFHSMT